MPQNPKERRGSQSWLRKVARAWSKLQISHRGGRYSVERMLALSEYAQKTSLWRVLLVCIATPIPMTVVIMLQELIPLQDPRDGWLVNYGFWIRYGFLAGVICSSMAVHAMHMIDGVSLSLMQVIALGVILGSTFPVVGMGFAALWAFPVPFIALLLNTIFVVSTVAVFRVMVGREAFSRILRQKYQCLQYFHYITVQMLMSVVYPAYQVLFGVVTNTPYELPVILILPIVKLIMKNLLSLTILHLEDMLPLEVIFVVDFFNAFYLVTCVQSAQSTNAIVTILAIDISQSALELYRLYRRTKSIATKMQHAIGEGNIRNLILLNAVQRLCESPEKLDSNLLPGIRLRSNSVLQSNQNVWLGDLEKRRASEASTVQSSPILV